MFTIDTISVSPCGARATYSRKTGQGYQFRGRYYSAEHQPKQYARLVGYVLSQSCRVVMTGAHATCWIGERPHVTCLPEPTAEEIALHDASIGMTAAMKGLIYCGSSDPHILALAYDKILPGEMR